MKVILKIGYTEILLPSMTGVQTVLNTLAKGVICDDRSGRWNDDPKISIKETIRLEMSVVPQATRIVMDEDITEETIVKSAKLIKGLRELPAPRR